MLSNWSLLDINKRYTGGTVAWSLSIRLLPHWLIAHCAKKLVCARVCVVTHRRVDAYRLLLLRLVCR